MKGYNNRINKIKYNLEVKEIYNELIIKKHKIVNPRNIITAYESIY